MPKRYPYDLGNLSFMAGKIGRLGVLNCIPIVAGDSLSLSATSVIRFQPFVRPVVIDQRFDVYGFYIPYRWIYEKGRRLGETTHASGDWYNKLFEEYTPKDLWTYTSDATLTGDTEGSHGSGESKIDSHVTKTAAQAAVELETKAGLYMDVIPWGRGSLDNATWMGEGYNQIWNKWFRPKLGGVAELDLYDWDDAAASAATTDDPARSADDKQQFHRFGFPTARLPNAWNQGVAYDPRSIVKPTADPSTNADWKTLRAYESSRGLRLRDGLSAQELTDAASTTTGSVGAGLPQVHLDLTEVAQQEGRFRAEIARAWNSAWYRDILSGKYGGYGSSEIDKHPIMVLSHRQWLAGSNFVQTGGAAVGQIHGVCEAVVNYGMPRRFFPEHGTLWIVYTVRPPTVYENERHFLAAEREPHKDFLAYSGDPALWAVEPPMRFKSSDWFTSSDHSGSDVSPSVTEQDYWIPYGNWYRSQPNIVHPRYSQTPGYPFAGGVAPSYYSDTSVPIQSEMLCGVTDYDECFYLTGALNPHFHVSTAFGADVFRCVPPAASSVFAGA